MTAPSLQSDEDDFDDEDAEEDEDAEDDGEGDDEDDDEEEPETWQVVRARPNRPENAVLRLTSVLEHA